MRRRLKGQIPPVISRLEYLRDLILNDNELSGPIPREIGELKRLENLFIFKNRINGTIPVEIGNCYSMLNIIAYDNALTGKIPEEIGLLFATLRYLDLSFNHLLGDFPVAFGRLVKLETLYLNHNKLEGMIPKEINKMVSLKHMRLEENLFRNTVMNVGPIEVYSDQTHIDLTEQWTARWNIGPNYPTGDDYTRWKAGLAAEMKGKVAKAVKGHADRLRAGAKAQEDAAPQPGGDTKKPYHPFSTKVGKESRVGFETVVCVCVYV